ncbi:sugar phosphate isomerase/epimerase family protein [Lentibacillus saliphilus]|uniref:sugar phosphate isomerase/epimerase family protein n=1 Tax=Lentibacillus saliphilus TaxID=2737028 RepID=UPI001C311969|nr:sugar phosphate isomerase/epimerase family protein [Lentibacillus saliphilus]
MKLGMSSYSLVGALNSGDMSILDVIDWTADHGGEHVELVPMGYTLTDNPDLVKAIVQKAQAKNIVISNYAIGADFLPDTEEAFEQEIERVKKEVDIANQLGAKRMRHDVSFKPSDQASYRQFEKDLPRLVEACQRIADYAKQYDIVTSIENHGFYIQASERIQRIIHEVDRPNFKTTLDTGNFLCVDEDPIAAVKQNIHEASMIHIKDFYYRPSSWYNPGAGWLVTTAGNYIRGAITGHGDIDLREVIKVIKASGYDGYISIEFEGLEPCQKAAQLSMENVRKIWESV